MNSLALYECIGYCKLTDRRT